MKITINIPTGEIYPPKAGDCYQGVVGTWLTASHDYCMPRKIGTRHEIEVPEDADMIVWDAIKRERWDIPGIVLHGVIPLPKPKVKVKRWQWVIPNSNCLFTTGFLTKEEVVEGYPNRKWYHRVDETEREVEE